jgi:hypothetical protein
LTTHSKIGYIQSSIPGLFLGQLKTCFEELMAVLKEKVTSMPARPYGIGKRTVARDFTKEYVVAGGYTAGQERVLAGTNDDLEVEVDLATYDRMENDSTIIKSKRILITGTLADEMQLAPGATEDEVGEDEYQVYEKIMGHCQRIVDGLDRPYRETLEQLLGNSIRYGHGIAESEWEYRMDGDPTEPTEDPKNPPSKFQSMWQRFGYFFGIGSATPTMSVSNSVLLRPTLNSEQMRLMPKAIKVKPRGAARFVVDDFMNVVGLTPKYKNGTNLSWNEIIDRDKFLVLTMHKQDEDPRGKSSYRPAFNWINLKAQIPSEMLRLILEETVPKAVLTLSENATQFEQEMDVDGNYIYNDEEKQDPKMIPTADSAKFIIENFRSGSGAVLPYGMSLKPYAENSGDAKLVAQIIKIIDDQIENAILLQTLAQSEGEHQARSASQQVAELLHNLIFWIRWLIGMMTLIDLFEVSVKMNYGDWAVKYLPQVSLGDFVRRDWGNDLEKVADAYYKGFIDDTQRPELMAWLNLPRPGQSRQEMEAEAPSVPDVNGEPAKPNKDRADKNAGKGRTKGNGTEKKNVKQSTDAVTGFSISNALGHHKRGTGLVSRHLFSGRK